MNTKSSGRKYQRRMGYLHNLKISLHKSSESIVLMKFLGVWLSRICCRVDIFPSQKTNSSICTEYSGSRFSFNPGNLQGWVVFGRQHMPLIFKIWKCFQSLLLIICFLVYFFKKKKKIFGFKECPLSRCLSLLLSIRLSENFLLQCGIFILVCCFPLWSPLVYSVKE